jgi:hypothetical protein
MNVRIRFRPGRPLQHRRGKNRQQASALAALLVPASLMAYALGIWGFAYDLGLAGEFGIAGVFSHWQVWIGLAVVVHISSYSLNRYGRGGDLKVPRVLTPFPSRPHTPAEQRKGA